MPRHEMRQWLSRILLITLIATGSILVAACGEDGGDGGAVPTQADVTTAPPEATTPPDTPTPVPPTATAAVEGTTAESLSEAGQAVYAEHCLSCHGEQGEGGVGPALIGERAHLDSYGTAGALYNYVHIAMPQNAPGSLSDEQYLEVVTFLLLQNDLVQPDTPVSIDQLGEIEL